MDPDPSTTTAPGPPHYPAPTTAMAANAGHPGLGVALSAQPPDAAAAAAVATAAAAADASASLLTPEEAAQHVTIWNRLERRKIAGNAAPLRRNLGKYLKKHPECEEFDGQDKCIEGLLTIDPATGMPVVAQNEHVPIWHIRDGRKVTGNAAPLRKNLQAYLRKHPECAVYAGQDKEDPVAAAAAAAAAARAAAAAAAVAANPAAAAAAAAAAARAASSASGAAPSGRAGRTPGRPGRPTNAMKAAQAAEAAARHQLAQQQHNQHHHPAQPGGHTAPGHVPAGAAQTQAAVPGSGGSRRFVGGGVTPAPRQPSIFVPRYISGGTLMGGAPRAASTSLGSLSTVAGDEPPGVATAGPWNGGGGSTGASANSLLMSMPQTDPSPCSHGTGTVHGPNCQGQSCDITYEDIAHSWSYMPPWQNAFSGAGGPSGELGVPVPSMHGATAGSAGRGILSGVGSFDRDVAMGGMSFGNSVGAGDGVGMTPTGGIGGFLFGHSRGVDGIAESPAAMDFSPSNFLTRGPTSPPSSRNR